MERLQITTISWTKKPTESFLKKSALNQKQKKSGLRQNVLKPDFFYSRYFKNFCQKILFKYNAAELFLSRAKHKLSVRIQIF